VLLKRLQPFAPILQPHACSPLPEVLGLQPYVLEAATLVLGLQPYVLEAATLW
jgi:hypothetical protein